MRDRTLALVAVTPERDRAILRSYGRMRMSRDKQDKEPTRVGPEVDILLSLGRLDPDPQAIERCRELFASGVNWAFLLDQAVRHRMMPLVAWNIDRFGIWPGSHVHAHVLRASYLYNLQRNVALMRELAVVLRALDQLSVRPLLRKGGYLATVLFPDLGLRQMTDFDFFVNPDDEPDLVEALAALGYQRGRLSPDARTLAPFSRETDLYWRLNFAVAPHLVRTTSDPYVGTLFVEFRYNVCEPAANKQISMDDWFNAASRATVGAAMAWIPSREHVFIDLCAHLHREATTLASIAAGKDLTLSKYLDIAEALRSPVVAPNVEQLAALVETYDLGREVYYAIYGASRLFPGAVPPEVLARFRPADLAYLDEYGELDGQVHRWDEPFEVRFFDPERSSKARGTPTLVRSVEPR